MTEEEPKKETYALEEIAQYRPMALAPELLKAKDFGGLESTIVTLFERLGIKEKGAIEAAVQPYFSKIQAAQGFPVLQNFTGNFIGRYQEALYSQKIKDLRKLYDSHFAKYFKNEEDLKQANEIFDSDETYESIRKKTEQAEDKAENKVGNFTEEEQKKAEKQLEYLHKIVIPLQSFEAKELKKLRDPIEDESLVKTLHAIYNPKKKGE